MRKSARRNTAGLFCMIAIVLSCVALPFDAFLQGEHAFAVSGQTALQAQPASVARDLSIAYPYADVDGDGENDYILEVGQLARYYSFSYTQPNTVTLPQDGYVTARFSLNVTNSDSYFYRVTNPLDDDAVTYGNYLTPYSVQEAMVSTADMHVGDSFDKGTTVCDFSKNIYDTGDLFLNVGPTGHLRLQVGEEFSLYPYRSWLPIEGTGNSKMLHPDYHVEVVNIDGADAVCAEECMNDAPGKHKWVLHANSNGTALVKVTYDALVHGCAGGGSDFSAIWPENTGLFVVSVQDAEDVEMGATVNENLSELNVDKLAGTDYDAELDTLYYFDVSGADYTLHPAEGSTVEVARGSVVDGKLEIGEFGTEGVVLAQDGSVAVTGLMQGKHIVRVSRGDAVSYQVLRVKQASWKAYGGGKAEEAYLIATSGSSAVNAYSDGVTPITQQDFDALDADARRSFDPLAYAGGTVTFVFDRLYHPANKLPGCYNMNALIALQDNDGTLFEQPLTRLYGDPCQYTFASTESCQTATIDIPEDAEQQMELRVFAKAIGYGLDYGSHRAFTYEEGSQHTGNYLVKTAYFGSSQPIALTLTAGGNSLMKARAAAAAFENAVDAIGEVDLASSGRIAEARALYDGLSSEAIKLVRDGYLASLESAEAQLVMLRRTFFDPVDIEDDCVRVVIENTTYPEVQGAPWDGVLLDEQVEIDSLTDTMRTLVDKALTQRGMLESVGDEGYIHSIEGLAEKDHGGASGWMATLNGWFINKGLNEFAAKDGGVKQGDEIRLLYSTDGGPDVGSDFTDGSKLLDYLIVKGGVLTPSFSSDVHEYVLNVPKDNPSVYVKPVPKSSNWQVFAFLGEQTGDGAHRLNDPIGVSEGSVIAIVVGDPSWPTMNADQQPAQVYRLTVHMVDEGSGRVDDQDNASGGSSSSAAISAFTVNKTKVTKAALVKACKKAGANARTVKTIILGPKVKKLSKGALRAFPKVKALVVKTKKLKKSSVKGALKGSKVKTIVVQVGGAKLNKKYVKKYKKLFTKKACGRKARVK